MLILDLETGMKT